MQKARSSRGQDREEKKCKSEMVQGVGERCDRGRGSDAEQGDLVLELLHAGKKLLVANGFEVGLLTDEGKSAAGLQDALIDFGERSEALFAGSCLQLRQGDEFVLQVLSAHLAVFHQNIGLSFDQLIQFLVTVQEADHQVVGGEERSCAQKPPGDGVIVSDDGVLDGVR